MPIMHRSYYAVHDYVFVDLSKEGNGIIYVKME